MSPRRTTPPRESLRASPEVVESSDRRDAIELFSVDADGQRHHGRSLVRAHILTMTPEDGRILPGVLYRPDGAFWGVTGVDGTTLAIRTETFISAAVARADAEELLLSARDFRYVPVADATGRSSIWVVHAGRVVLVAGRVQRGNLHRLEQTLRGAITRVAPRVVPRGSGSLPTPSPAAADTTG